MVPRVDFDIVEWILKVLEGWELGNKGLYRKYQSYKKSYKFQNYILVPGVHKTDVYDFSGFFTRKIRNTGISNETTIPGISSETTILGISSETTIPGITFAKNMCYT